MKALADKDSKKLHADNEYVLTPVTAISPCRKGLCQGFCLRFGHKCPLSLGGGAAGPEDKVKTSSQWGKFPLFAQENLLPVGWLES
jgi:hypothetical protein